MVLRGWRRSIPAALCSLGKRHLLLLPLGTALLCRVLVSGCSGQQQGSPHGSCQNTKVTTFTFAFLLMGANTDASGCVLDVNFLGLFKAES